MVMWRGLCGQSCPRQELEFLVQAFVLFVVISVSLYNLTVGGDKDREVFWASIFSACVGIAIPGPLIKTDNNKKKREDKTEETRSIVLSNLSDIGETELDQNVHHSQSPEQ